MLTFISANSHGYKKSELENYVDPSEKKDKKKGKGKSDTKKTNQSVRHLKVLLLKTSGSLSHTLIELVIRFVLWIKPSSTSVRVSVID